MIDLRGPDILFLKWDPLCILFTRVLWNKREKPHKEYGYNKLHSYNIREKI